MTDETQLLKFRNVVAHGVDVVDTADFARLINKQAGNFLDRYFTPEELATADEGGNRAERLSDGLAAVGDRCRSALSQALDHPWVSTASN